MSVHVDCHGAQIRLLVARHRHSFVSCLEAKVEWLFGKYLLQLLLAELLPCEGMVSLRVVPGIVACWLASEVVLFR
jgi:hypothetical protein